MVRVPANNLAFSDFFMQTLKVSSDGNTSIKALNPLCVSHSEMFLEVSSTNSIDPDQTASQDYYDLGPHCFQYTLII